MGRIRQIIRQAIITLITDDTTAFPQGQAKYNGKVTAYTPLSPYGLFGKAPLSSWVLLLSSNNQEAVKFGIESDFLNRKKSLSAGECGLYNTATESIIWLKADGSIFIESKDNLDLTVAGNLAANVTGTADITATGDATIDSSGNSKIKSTGTTTVEGANVTVTGTTTIENKVFLTHQHSGVTAGAANTGGVV